MFTKETVQAALNHDPNLWGRSLRSDTRDLWNTPESAITSDDAITAGIQHSCPVIEKVSKTKTPLEMWRSYTGKNIAFEAISDLFDQANRPDLKVEWHKNEIRSSSQKTHPEVKAVAQYPASRQNRFLSANARMSQYYLSDHFKTLDHIVHGALPSPSTPEDRSKYEISISDYQKCAENAHSLDHFTALVAVNTAQILQKRGIDNHSIAALLSQNFAQTGTIREYGQDKHAQRILSQVLTEIKQVGSLPGLSKEIRKISRPKIQKYYSGQRNPRL